MYDIASQTRRFAWNVRCDRLMCEEGPWIHKR
jgi:hypothetical protein